MARSSLAYLNKPHKSVRCGTEEINETPHSATEPGTSIYEAGVIIAHHFRDFITRKQIVPVNFVLSAYINDYII
jgi:hypothetical protein